MACFPRFNFHRSKNTFTPATDTNTDTILNNNDSSVQMCRYIRREETPLITSKSTDRLKEKHKQKLPSEQLALKSANIEVLQQHDKTDYYSNANGDAIHRTDSGSNISTTKEINLKKKFISNKFKLKSNESMNDSNAKLPNGISTQSKLKPVKERRPTALPTDAPNNMENDLKDDIDNTGNENVGADEIDQFPIDLQAQRAELDSIGDTSLMNGYISTNATNTETNTAANTPTIEADAVKFFIGARYGSLAQDDDLSMTATDFLTNGNFNQDKSRPLPGFKKQNSSNDMNNYVNSYSANKNNSINSRKNAQLSRTTSSHNLQNYNIPPPPPLPPTPLITPSPSISMLSRKSKKCSCNSFQKMSTSHECYANDGYDFLNMQKPKTKKSNLELQSYTITEVLKIGSISLHGTLTKSKKNYYNYYCNGRDSGVQIEEPTSSPKNSNSSSGSITSHRIDGGIIFQRPNLPEKKNVQIIYIEKDEATRNLIRTAIERNDFLNNYMDKERKEMVIDAMAPLSYEKDSYIIHEDDEGAEIYVAEDGFFDVIKEGKVVGSFGPMTVFGELAILYNAKRQASIKASTNARVWKIERETFRDIMKISGSKERQENLNFLRTVPFLNDLGEDMLIKIVDLLRKKFFETNNCIVREGEVGNEFFIIRGGTVTIKKKNEENVERVVDRRKRGDYFGEQALLNADHRQASVYADAPGTEVLILEREAFISYLGTIPQLHERPIERELPNDLDIERKKSEFNNEYAHVQLSELKKIATLGAGAFGRVDLVAYGEKTFALKIIKKIDVVKQDQVEHVYNEKRVMIKCHTSPFIIELFKTYRNEKFVYFLMEACMGGDVWTVMSQRRFFDEKTARFIAGCVVEAFDFLHSHNIIYRDLKPENLMLTTDGYCKLVDFGFAKQIPVNQKTNTFAGTPEYVAPEIILDRGHDRAVDYWALGILIFELLVGKTPFRGQNQIKIYQQILGGIDVISMPSKIPKSAQNLIRSLCKQLPAERLGYQRRGIQDIKKHSWFDNLDWNKLRNKQLPSPIKRPILSNTDIQYFVPIGIENEKEPPDEMSGWDIDF